MTGANSPSALPLGAVQVDVSIFKNDRIGEQSVYNVCSFSVSPQTFNDLAKKPAGPLATNFGRVTSVYLKEVQRSA